MTPLHRYLALSVLLASGLASSRASADVQACLGASEKGQRARTAGKLREAREQFLLCSSDGCPAMVRRDCAQWQSEVIATLPSIVLGAKDRGGRDLFDVTVSVDGEPLVKKLDGKSLPIDPGPHTFKFEMAGAPPVIERALVKEGEKTRVITVTFAIGTPSSDTPRPRRRSSGRAGRQGAAARRAEPHDLPVDRRRSRRRDDGRRHRRHRHVALAPLRLREHHEDVHAPPG